MRLFGFVFFVALSWFVLAVIIAGLATLASLVGWLGTLLCLAFVCLFVALSHSILVEEPHTRFVVSEPYDYEDEL